MRLVLLLLAAALVAPAPAAAAELVRLPGEGAIHTDGDRFTARPLEPTGVHVRVRDQRSDRPLTIAAPARSCFSPVLGSGMMARVCHGVPGHDPSDDVAIVHDLRTGAPAPPVSLRLGIDPDAVALVTGVGRRWLAVHLSVYHANRDVALDYRTREVLDDPGDGRHTVQDLDRARAQRRLCRPLARTPGPTDDEDFFDEWPAFEPFTYTGRHGIDHATLALRLQRCGSGRARRLDPYMPPFGGTVQLSRTAVTWVDGTRRAPVLRAHLLRSGRTRSWPIRGAADATLHVAHTARYVYVSRWRRNGAVEVLRGRL